MTSSVVIQNAAKVYGTTRVVDDVSFEVAQGEFFGLLGPNGAGKTTLINLMAGLARLDGGSIRVMNHDVVQDPYSVRRSLGIVPQEIAFDPFFTARETLRIQSGYFSLRANDDWIDEILERLGLTPHADFNMRTLSGGMKRRVLVAQALVHRPPVIVLDEPTAGVDIELRRGLWQFIGSLNRQGHTIILTTHYLEEAEEQCHRLALLKQGKIAALDSTHKLLQRLAGVLLRVRLQPGKKPPAMLNAQEPDRDVYVFQLHHTQEVQGVLQALTEAGCQCSDVEIQRPDLGQVFHYLMQDA